MKSAYFLLILTIFFSACNYQSEEYKALKAQNDSLLRAKQAMQEELDDYFSVMNQIEQNIEKIKETEGVISTKSGDTEIDADTRSKINEDLLYLNDLLRANKEELSKLKKRIKDSAIKSNELERTLARLTKALEQESAKVALLETEIAKKDSVIAELGSAVEVMGKDIEVLKSDVESKTTKIQEQEDAIHTAWYVFGTRKELREQNIVTSDGLFRPKRVLESDFNKNYFVRIDARKTKSIPLYSTIAKILTSHPKSSYTLEKENSNFVLLIVDTDVFWSVSKYLVIEVD